MTSATEAGAAPLEAGGSGRRWRASRAASLLARHPRLAAALAATLVYGLALIVSLHAVLFHPGSRVIYGLNDGTSSLRDYWAASVQHRTPFTFSHDALDGAPQGFLRVPATVLANGAIQAGVIWELRGALGEVGAYNAFMLIGLVATGLAMFAFLRRLGCSLAASLLGGYVFAFSPYALERAYAGHVSLLQNWIFPLLGLVLLRVHERRAPRDALLAGLLVALAFYLSAYQGLFAVFMALVFALVELVRLTGRRERLALAGSAVACGLVAAAALSPIFVLYAREQSDLNLTTARTSDQFYKFAAWLTAYIVPSERNPLFHWVRANAADLTEETLFFGYVTLALAAACIVLLVRGDAWLARSETRRSAAWYLLVLAVAAFLFSFAPTYQVGPLKVPFPSDLLGHLSSFWRVYARFGILVGFALVTLAALALTSLARRPGRRWRALVPLASLLLVVELLPGNVRWFDASATPAWAQWLRSQPQAIVVTYPWFFSGELPLDAWYQMSDRDPQFAIFDASAAQKMTRDYGIRLLTRDVWREQTAGVLAAEHVRYLVVHEDAYLAAGQGLQNLNRRQYRLVKTFGPTRIYTIVAAPSNIPKVLRDNAAALGTLEDLVASLGYGGGFNAPESFDGLTSRWMIQRGQLVIDTNAAADVTLRGVAFSNQSARVLELEDGSGRVLARRVIPPFAVHVRLGPFRVGAGQTTLTLVVSPGPQLLGANDSRSASVFLEPFRIQALPPYAAAPAPPA